MPVVEPWVKCPAPKPQAPLRLFCFPYAGGGATAYRLWPDLLPPHVEACLVQLPGRENRLMDSPFSQLTTLVQTLGNVLQPYLNRPFAFFGHSMGALIGFELTRWLQRQNASGPVRLFVAGHCAPQIPRSDPPIRHLPDSEFKEELQRFGGTPDAVLQHPELMDLLLPLLRADFSVVETYVYSPQEPLDCSISAFGGLHDTDVSRDDLERWREQTRGSFTIRMFPGNHFFLHSAQHLLVRALSQDLGQYLGQAGRERSRDVS